MDMGNNCLTWFGQGSQASVKQDHHCSQLGHIKGSLTPEFVDEEDGDCDGDSGDGDADDAGGGEGDDHGVDDGDDHGVDDGGDDLCDSSVNSAWFTPVKEVGRSLNKKVMILVILIWSWCDDDNDANLDHAEEDDYNENCHEA